MKAALQFSFINMLSPACVGFDIKIHARQTNKVFHLQSAILQWPCELLVAARQIKRLPTGSPSAHAENHAISTFTHTQSPNPTWPPCLLPGCEIKSDNHSQRAQSACIWSCALIVAVVVEMTSLFHTLTANTAVLILSPRGKFPLEYT